MERRDCSVPHPPSQREPGRRIEAVLLGAVGDQGAGEGALSVGASDALGVDAQKVVAELEELVELEQALELSAKDIGRAHGDRSAAPETTCDCPRFFARRDRRGRAGRPSSARMLHAEAGRAKPAHR